MSEAHTTITQLAEQSLGLAIARYMRDHPQTAAAPSAWQTPDIQQWRALSEPEIAARASDKLAELERWKDRVQAEDQQAWNVDRVRYLHAKLALQSARSGSFETAAGALHDFLREVGANANELDIH
jgi:hypothetical protein